MSTSDIAELLDDIERRDVPDVDPFDYDAWLATFDHEEGDDGDRC